MASLFEWQRGGECLVSVMCVREIWSLQYRTNPLVKEQAESTGNGLHFGVGFTEYQDVGINQISP